MAIDAKLRGINKYEDLKERATNPILRSEVRGKTLKELGVLKGNNDVEKMTEKKGLISRKRNDRSLQETRGKTVQFFTVRDWRKPLNVILLCQF